MKKLLIPAFACAAMFTACGDDSSSASSEAVESSSSIAAESSGSVVLHEEFGEFLCAAASDTTTVLRYSFDGPDSAMAVTNYVYPKVTEDVEKVCEEAKAKKTDEQKVTCEPRVEISYPSKTMTFDDFFSMMKKECYQEKPVNAVDLVDPDMAPENGNTWENAYIHKCLRDMDPDFCAAACLFVPVQLPGCPNNNPSL